MTTTRHIVNIDFASLANDPLKRPTKMDDDYVAFTAQDYPISYYTLATDLKKPQRGAVAVQLLDYIDSYAPGDGEIESWIWTLVDLFFPGLPEMLFNRNKNIAYNKVPITDDQLNYLIGGGKPSSREAYHRTTHGLGPNDPVPPLADLDYVPSPGFNLLPDLVFDITKSRMNNWYPLVNVFGIILFAIGKNPTAQNLIAFNEKRFRAGTNKAGLGGEEQGNFSKSDLPKLPTYAAIQGYFNLHPRARGELVKELVSWTMMTGTAEQEIVATHTKLWSGMGMAHIKFISQMIINHGHILTQIEDLTYELEKFHQGFIKFQKEKDVLKPFWKVLYGDKRDVLPSRDFAELLKLALQIEKSKNQNLSLYAQTIGNSKYYDLFKKKETTPAVEPEERANEDDLYS